MWRAGADCEDNRIYKLSAPWPETAPFNAIAGVRYWLQISEPDLESLAAGVEDFRWSAHRPVVDCPAMQAPPLGVLPPDSCDGQQNDLAFTLNSRILKINIPPVVAPETLFTDSVWRWELRELGGLMCEAGCAFADEEGDAILAPESPDGAYVLNVCSTGTEPQEATVLLETGTEMDVQFGDVCIGDTNRDAVIDALDIQQFVTCVLGLP
ncbi:MAG: hypothetical protein ABII12_09695 [Planctomycetota bacterium]